MHSEAAKVVNSKKTHKRIWKSESLDRYCWVFIPPGEAMHTYSGNAVTLEQAEEDILKSAEHFIKVHRA